ncbi:MAG: PqqD family peptide modification chaperone [Hyphomicrobiaceae bacterium]
MVPAPAVNTTRADGTHEALSLREIEIAPLGGEYVLHAPKSGTIILANHSAVELCRALEASGSTARAADLLSQWWHVDAYVAQRYVQALLEDWRRAGLFDNVQPTSVEPITAEDIAISWAKTYRSGVKPVRVRCESPAVGAILDRVLSVLEVEQPTARDHSWGLADPVTVDLSGRHDNFMVRKAGRTVWGPSDFASARHMALREILCASNPPGAISAVLHAGAVAKNGGAVIIAGDSGAGKTTLLSSLVLAGWDYLSDDLTGLDTNGNGIRPFPVAISLKPGSAALLSSAIEREPDLSLSPPDEFGLRYCDASARRASAEVIPASLLCFPHHDASCPDLIVERLSPTAALSQLLKTGTRLIGNAPTLSTLTRLLSKVPSVSLRYRERAEAEAFLEEQLS